MYVLKDGIIQQFPMHKVSQYIESYRCIETVYGGELSKETYQVLVVASISLSGSVFGFIATQSELILNSIGDHTFFKDNAYFSTGGNNGLFAQKFTTVFMTGQVLGCIVSFVLNDNFGRQHSLIYASIVCVFTMIWSIITYSSANLLTARFFTGACIGVMLTTVPTYISEICSFESRGRCLSYFLLAIFAGNVSAVLLYVSMQGAWRLELLLPILILLVQITMLFQIPNSHRWILAHKTPAESLAAMKKLRRTQDTHDVNREFNDIYRALTSDAKLGDGWVDLLASKSICLRLVIGMFFQVSPQLVGGQLIKYFTYSSVMQSYYNSGEDSSSASTPPALGLVGTTGPTQMMTAAVFAIVPLLTLMGKGLGLGVLITNIDLHGRRALLMLGCVMISICWLFLWLCFYGGMTLASTSSPSNNNGPSDVHDLLKHIASNEWLFGVFCLFIFVFQIADSMSFESFKWIYPCEIFPFRARSKASSLILFFQIFVNWTTSLTLAFFTDSNDTSSYADMGSTCIVFAVLSLLLCGLVYIYIPETKDMRLEVMEDLFKVEGAHPCLLCLPDLCCLSSSTGSGMLGLRSPIDSRPSSLRIDSSRPNSLRLPSINSINLQETTTLSGGVSQLISSYQHEDSLIEDDEMELSTLHKYSAHMRDMPFDYLQDDRVAFKSMF